MAAMTDWQPHELRYGPQAALPSQAPTRPLATSRVPAAVWPIFVLIAATGVGVGTGAGIYAIGARGNQGDGWGALGAFLLGLAVGIIAFVVTYVVGLVLAAARVFPLGRRILPVTLSLAIPALVAATTLALTAVAENASARSTSGQQVMTTIAFLGSLVAAPASFAWAGSRRGRRGLAIGTAALVVLMVGATSASVVVARDQLDETANRLPLVLFTGGTATAPFDNWRPDHFSRTTITADSDPFVQRGKAAYLKYMGPGGVVFVTMHTNVGTCGTTARYTCRTTGSLRGNELRRYDRIARYGSYPRSAAFDVLVYPDGSGVSVNDEGPSGHGIRTEPTQVFASLVRVDRDAFERATDALLRLP